MGNLGEINLCVVEHGRNKVSEDLPGWADVLKDRGELVEGRRRISFRRIPKPLKDLVLGEIFWAKAFVRPTSWVHRYEHQSSHVVSSADIAGLWNPVSPVAVEETIGRASKNLLRILKENPSPEESGPSNEIGVHINAASQSLSRETFTATAALLAGEGEGGGEADARAGPDDQHDLSVEALPHHVSPIR